MIDESKNYLKRSQITLKKEKKCNLKMGIKIFEIPPSLRKLKTHLFELSKWRKFFDRLLRSISKKGRFSLPFFF